MPGRLIDQPHIKPLLDAIEEMVRKDGIDKKFVLPDESKETVLDDAIREIVSNIAEFDIWYFDKEDERYDRLPKEWNPDHGNGELSAAVKEVVDYNLEGMREFDELTVEPDVDRLVNQLIEYIVRWEDWYPEYRISQVQQSWYDNLGINEEIYDGSDYGDPETSQGISDIYNEDNAPYSNIPTDPDSLELGEAETFSTGNISIVSEFQSQIVNDDKEYSDKELVTLLNALDTVLTQEAMVALRTGEASKKVSTAATTIDAAIKNGKGLSKSITLYKGYEGFDGLKGFNGGQLTENSFFVGSTNKITNAETIISLTVPEGTHALRLTEDVYILPRRLVLDLDSSGIATVAKSLTTSIRLSSLDILNTSQSEVEEFFNKHHDKRGRFSSKSGGGGGGGTAERTPEEEARRSKTRKIIAGIAVAVVVVVAVGVILSGNKPPQATAPGTDKPEPSIRRTTPKKTEEGHKGDEKSKPLNKIVEDHLGSSAKGGALAKWTDEHEGPLGSKTIAKKVQEVKTRKDQEESVRKSNEIEKSRLDKVRKAEEEAVRKVQDKEFFEQIQESARQRAARKAALRPVDPDEKANYDHASGVLEKTFDAKLNMSDAEKTSIFKYGTYRYGDIQSHLRGTDVEEVDPDGHRISRKPDPITPTWIQHIDSAFERHGVDANGVVVYRGIDMDASTLRVGDIIRDKGYVSTSADVKIAENFVARNNQYTGKRRNKDAVVMKIKTRQKTKVVGTDADQDELLMNRGTPMHIKKIEFCPDGICRVDVEVL